VVGIRYVFRQRLFIRALDADDVRIPRRFYLVDEVQLTAQPVDYLHDLLPNGITVSTCAFCNQIVGAGQITAVLEIVERIHECPGKRGFYDELEV
jgi:hypothetical protein